MATNSRYKKSKLSRPITKWCRDGIKNKYKRKGYCEICDTEEDLELHHYHSVTFLIEKYIKDSGIPEPTTDEEVLSMREDFYSAYMYELTEDVASLCSHHHTMLHKVYGQKPLLHSASKQRVWVEKQYEKAHGIVPEQSAGLSSSGHISLLSFMV